MKHIRELDRPVFDNEFFENNVFKVSASEDILNTVFAKNIKFLLYNITIIGFDKFLNSF